MNDDAKKENRKQAVLKMIANPLQKCIKGDQGCPNVQNQPNAPPKVKAKGINQKLQGQQQQGADDLFATDHGQDMVKKKIICTNDVYRPPHIVAELDLQRFGRLNLALHHPEQEINQPDPSIKPKSFEVKMEIHPAIIGDIQVITT
jgi:hypothetical protein